MYTLDELTLSDLLCQKATTHRNETFLKFRHGTLSFGEVERMAARLAHGLADHGVGQHDHVAVMLPNCADFLYVIFALARLGAVAVPINTDYKGELLRHVVTSSDATLLIVDAPFVERLARVEADLPELRSVVVRTDGAVDRSLQTPALALTELLGDPDKGPRAPVRFCDLQAIMYTSGTTGPSKGVMVSHALALTCALDSMTFMTHQPDQTIYLDDIKLER